MKFRWRETPHPLSGTDPDTFLNPNTQKVNPQSQTAAPLESGSAMRLLDRLVFQDRTHAQHPLAPTKAAFANDVEQSAIVRFQQNL